VNKLLGFFELKDSGLPAVPWKAFDENASMAESLLWTVRTAIDKGEDLNLPRLVGVEAKEAYEGALGLYKEYKNSGMIVYYPYFIAVKSGTLYVDNSRIVIEAVKSDLWNFVTYNRKDVSIIIDYYGKMEIQGDSNFLQLDEIKELKNYALKVKGLFRDVLYEGKAVLLEWSYAFNTDVCKKPIGEKYLVFYEIRTV
jgi:hypothetical protein